MSRWIPLKTQLSESATYKYSAPGFVVSPGPLLFIQGQVAWDENMQVVGSDFASQTRQVFANLAAILEKAGGSLADIVHMLVFLTDMGRIDEFVAVREEFYPSSVFPPSTAVEVTRLIMPELQIEIHAVAAPSAP
jgi:2-iminobutanoate/2-iminopropanoate deaminase